MIEDLGPRSRRAARSSGSGPFGPGLVDDPDRERDDPSPRTMPIGS